MCDCFGYEPEPGLKVQKLHETEEAYDETESVELHVSLHGVCDSTRIGKHGNQLIVVCTIDIVDEVAGWCELRVDVDSHIWLEIHDERRVDQEP